MTIKSAKSPESLLLKYFEYSSISNEMIDQLSYAFAALIEASLQVVYPQKRKALN